MSVVVLMIGRCVGRRVLTLGHTEKDGDYAKIVNNVLFVGGIGRGGSGVQWLPVQVGSNDCREVQKTGAKSCRRIISGERDIEIARHYVKA